MQTEYRPVAGFPNYRVGSDGSVWSKASGDWKPLSAGKTKSGHRVVVLVRPGEKRSSNVHRLVIEAFRGQCPEGKECLHANGNGSDNRVENLRWGTRKENCGDTVTHGRTTRGETNARCKLTREKVVEIRRICSMPGAVRKSVAKQFGISPAQVSSIMNGNAWKWLVQS